MWKATGSLPWYGSSPRSSKRRAGSTGKYAMPLKASRASSGIGLAGECLKCASLAARYASTSAA